MADGSQKNGKTSEELPQLQREIWHDIDQHLPDFVRPQTLHHQRTLEATIAGGSLDADPSPIYEPVAFGTVPTEDHDHPRQARLQRVHTYAQEAAGAMAPNLSANRVHENRSRDLSLKPPMRHAALSNVNFGWLMTGKCENDRKVDWTPLDLSLVDEDFELVLRHFWKRLDAESRRRLIQMAAGLVEGCEEVPELVRKA